MSLGESEVTRSTWCEGKRVAENLVGSELAFVDSLEKKVGLRLDTGPADGLEGVGLSLDSFIECEMGLSLDRPTKKSVNGDQVDNSGAYKAEVCGPGSGLHKDGEEIVVAGPISGLGNDGEATQSSLGEAGLLQEGVDILDGKAKPTTVPTEGFLWQFLANI